MDLVGQLIDDARKDARMKWADLARAADIDPQTLRRYKTGERRTADTTRAIEIAFNWPRGYIDAVAEGHEPPPIESEPKSEADEYADVRREIETRLTEAHDLLRRLDGLRQTRETG